MTARQMFLPSADSYDATRAGLFVMCAASAYGVLESETQEGQLRAVRFVAGVLAAARTNGYTQGDVLATLLDGGNFEPRTMDMCQEICDVAGAAALDGLFASMEAEGE